MKFGIVADTVPTARPPDPPHTTRGPSAAPGWTRPSAPWPIAGRLLLGLIVAWAFALRLVYGLPDPLGTRFWDERYVLHNVAAVLAGEEHRPVHAFYGGLSYLPQVALLAAADGLHGATGGRTPAIYRPEGGFSAVAVRLCRLVQIVYGTLAVLLVARIGRRLAGPACGLAAAFLTAAARDQILYSAYFKPDILVALLTLAALDLAITARRRPALGAYLAGGCAIGLAVAAKYTGVGAALPLAGAALAAPPRLRGLARLALAGAVALAAFVALNPYLDLTLEYVERLLALYDRKGEAAGGSHLAVLAATVGTWLAPAHRGVLGPAAGALGLAGAAWTALRLLRARRAPERAEPPGWGLALLYLAGFTLFYAAATRLYVANNLVPASPVLMLFAAHAAVAAAGAAALRLPRPARGVAGAAAAALAVAAWAPGAAAWSLEPWHESTLHAAVRRALEPGGAGAPEAAEVIYEAEMSGEVGAAAAARGAVAIPAPDLSALGDGALDRADVEVFPRDRILAAEPFYLRRLARVDPAAVLTVEPGWLRRGPAVVAAVHRWLGAPAARRTFTGADGPRVRQPLPPADGALYSLRVRSPRRWRAPHRLRLEVAGAELPLWTVGEEEDRRWLYASPRWPAGPPEVVVLLPERAGPGAEFEVEVWRWSGRGTEPGL